MFQIEIEKSLKAKLHQTQPKSTLKSIPLNQHLINNLVTTIYYLHILVIWNQSNLQHILILMRIHLQKNRMQPRNVVQGDLKEVQIKAPNRNIRFRINNSQMILSKVKTL